MRGACANTLACCVAGALLHLRWESEVGSGRHAGACAQGGNFTQAARLGPDGLVLGPNNAGVTAQRDDARDQMDVSLKNVKLSSDGVEFNAGSRTNSSINVSHPPLHAWLVSPDGLSCKRMRKEG